MDNVTHYLLNFTGKGEPVNPGTLAAVIGEGLASCGVDLLMATTYISKIAVDPRHVGIKDAWRSVTDDQKREMLKIYPHLVTAIDLICGVTAKD